MSRKLIFIALVSAAISGAALLILPGCTVVPHEVTVKAPAFVGNVQNGGVIAIRPDGVQVAPELVAKYAVLAKKYGKDLTPPVKPGDGVSGPLADGTFLIDKEHFADLATMNIMNRSGIKP
jgi:hypothetical protein